MKTVVLSDHAIFKLEVLKTHGFVLAIEVVQDAVAAPDRVDEGYGGRKVAQKHLDVAHVLRVVFEETEDEITVVTMYPGRRDRYEKDKIQ